MNTPFQVICIDTPLAYQPNIPKNGPVEGDIDTVIIQGVDDEIGAYYCFERFGEQWGYSTYHFVPLSEIDETEIEREYNHQTQTV